MKERTCACFDSIVSFAAANNLFCCSLLLFSSAAACACFDSILSSDHTQVAVCGTPDVFVLEKGVFRLEIEISELSAGSEDMCCCCLFDCSAEPRSRHFHSALRYSYVAVWGSVLRVLQ